MMPYLLSSLRTQTPGAIRSLTAKDMATGQKKQTTCVCANDFLQRQTVFRQSYLSCKICHFESIFNHVLYCALKIMMTVKYILMNI